MPSWLDKLPAKVREKAEQMKLSPEEYEKLREKVRERGPEYIEEEMERNEALAELRFALETEPEIRKALNEQIREDIEQQGIETVVEHADLPPEVRRALEEGRFAVSVEAPDERSLEQIQILPEGKVQEKLTLNRSAGERYIRQFKEKK